jgi:hypothetical protein
MSCARTQSFQEFMEMAHSYSPGARLWIGPVLVIVLEIQIVLKVW